MLRAVLLLSVLIAGCGINTAPLPDCQAPARPELPALISDKPLESSINMRILMERDDCMRLYIQGLEDTLECYKKTGGPYGPANNDSSLADS